MKTILLLALANGCATTQNSRPVEEDTFSTGSVLTLVQTSYIRGCIEGMNDLKSDKTKGARLDRCKVLSTKHEGDIRELLQAP